MLVTLPSGFGESVIASLPTSPTAMAITPDGSTIYVTTQSGPFRVIQNGSLLASNFATISTDNFFERGLLGIALHPGFATNRTLYTFHTTTDTGAAKRHVVTRWVASADLRTAAGPGTVIFSIPAVSAGNHNGGAMNFGPDGKLYIAVGDGASNPSDAQSLSNLNGKILRINDDGSIPSDNPFFSTAAGDNRAIYALGLRNPFTFAFQPGTGIGFVNDVGSSGSAKREEINRLEPGANYGWPLREGVAATAPAVSFGNYRNPVHAYADPGSTSITAATFYNPETPMFPTQYIGQFFFGDFARNFIRTIPSTAMPVPLGGTSQASSPFATGSSGPIDMDVHPVDGSLYLAEFSSRRIRRIFVLTSNLPTISNSPADQRTAVHQNATFSVNAATPAGNLSYQWQQASPGGTFANITGETNATYTRTNTQLADSGLRFRVLVSNSNGTVPSGEATLTVIDNTAPVPTINTPSISTQWAGGQLINFSGSATDAQDGTLPASAYSWLINYLTGTADGTPEIRPFAGPFDGITSGNFNTASSTPYLSTDVAYRITLTVTDSLGAQASTFVDIVPQTSTITLQSVPSGIQLTLDDVPAVTPMSVQTVVGLNRNMGAPESVTINGQTFQFENWSNGGTRNQVLNTPATNTTFTATFRDITQPTAIARSFQTDTPLQRLPVNFSENVFGSLSSSDVVLTNLTTGQVVPTSSINFAWDSNTNTATFSFASPLPDGDYSLLIPASSVTDDAGNTLTQNVTAAFHTLGGDFDRNRTVNFNDLVILARNFNKTPRVFSQGDADYNGTVDFADLVILSRNFNRTLVSPPPPVILSGQGAEIAGSRVILNSGSSPLGEGVRKPRGTVLV